MTPLRSRSLLAGLLLAVFGISVLPGAAAAGPKANLNQVQRQVDQLNRQAEQAAERYNTAKVELTDDDPPAARGPEPYAATQRRLDAMKVLVGRIAVASYKSGGLDSSVQLLLSDNPTGVPAPGGRPHPGHQAPGPCSPSMQAARLRAAVDRKAVAEQQARAEDLQGEIAAEKRTVEARLATAQALLGRLEAKQRAQLTSLARPPSERALGRSLGRHARVPLVARRRLPDVRRTGVRPCGGGREDRLRPARRPLRVGRGRAGLVRLLRPDDVLLGRCRRLAAALVLGAVLLGAARRPSATCSPATWSSTTARSATSASTSAAAGSSTRPTRGSACTSPACTRCRSSEPADRRSAARRRLLRPGAPSAVRAAAHLA